MLNISLYRAYFIEYVIGIVKTIPIQQPIKPIADPTPPTNNKRIIVKGCLLTIITLDFIASIAFKLPKIINGIVSDVNTVIANAIIVSTKIIPTKLKATEIKPLVSEINNAAMKSCIK